MQDRGYIKWAPFNSLINDKNIIKEVKEKEFILDKPELSEDQINILNDKIFDAYTNHYKVNLIIYKNMKLVKIIGFVNSINILKKYIIFNKEHIFFNQILKVYNFID